MASKTITIGPDFFRKERDSAYAYWAEAYWREHFQNSGDARARHVRVSISPLGGHVFRTVIEDDGHGMTRDVLDNVFFRLGASTKDTGGGQTGGFGRARIMTHFAQERYEIETLDQRVVGVGSSYEFVEPREHVSGCRMTIDVKALNRWGDPLDLAASLEAYLGDCQPSYDVTINGVPHSKWLYRRKVVRELPFGTVHVNRAALPEGSDRGRLIVRVNGTKMFDKDIMAKAIVIVEIDPAKSREVLNSNRDSLQYPYEGQLDEFVGELNRETTSALRQRKLADRSVFTGLGTFKAYHKQVTFTLSSRGDDVAQCRKSPALRSMAALAEVTVRKGTRVLADAPAAPGDRGLTPAAASAHNVHLAGRWEYLRPEPDAAQGVVLTEAPAAPTVEYAEGDVLIDAELRARLFDVLLYSDLAEFEDDEVKAVRRAMRRFNPDRWAVTPAKAVRGRDGSTRLRPPGFKGLSAAKLLLAWKAACEFAIDALLEATGRTDVLWGVGWYFGPAGGTHKAEEVEGETVHFLSLNPVDREGKDRYSIADRSDLGSLYALAAHEACHVVERYHDEDFAALLTRVVGIMGPRFGDFVRAIKPVRRVRMI